MVFIIAKQQTELSEDREGQYLTYFVLKIVSDVLPYF